MPAQAAVAAGLVAAVLMIIAGAGISPGLRDLGVSSP